MQGPQQFELEDRWQGSSISRQGSYQATPGSLARILLAAAGAILQIPAHNSVWAGPTVTTHTKPTLLVLPPPLPPPLKRVYPQLAHTHISINIPQKCSWEPCPTQLCSNPWQRSQLIKACPQSSTRGAIKAQAKIAPKLQMWRYRASQHYPRNWPQGCLQESTLISPSYPQQKGDADPPLMNWRARWF